MTKVEVGCQPEPLRWLARRTRPIRFWCALAVAGVALVALPLAATNGETAPNTRTLEVYNTHTKERASITFKRKGRYDAAGLRKLNHILRDWRRNEVTKMDPKLFDLLWEVRRESGSRKPIHVVSGYRSPVTNAALRKRSRGVAKNSQHTRGRATDFFIPDVPVSKIRKIALRKQVGGVGYYPRSGTPFVHLDTGSVRAWPRLSRKQLVALFPDGKTLHLPSDGKPLKGYAAAEKLERAGKLEKLSSGGRVVAAAVRRSKPKREKPKAGTRTANSSSGGGIGRFFARRNKEADRTSASRSKQEASQASAARSGPAATGSRETLPGVRAPAPVRSEPKTAFPAVAPVPNARPSVDLPNPVEPEKTPNPAPAGDGPAAAPEERLIAVVLPQPRPEQAPVAQTDSDLALAGTAQAARDIARAYSATNRDRDPLAAFIRGGRPLSELDATGRTERTAPALRPAGQNLMALSYSDAPPDLAGSVSLARTGSTRFFRHPDQRNLEGGLSAPRLLVVNAFGAMVPTPSIGAFEGRAIAPVAFRRTAPSNRLSAALSKAATALR